MIDQDFVKRRYLYSNGRLLPHDVGKFQQLKSGYRITQINRKTYYEHQLVFLYHKGFIPKMIDHINGDKSDNRIENLRECTNAQNQYNSKRKRTNKAGAKGVVFHSNCKSRPYQAKIVVQGRTISLGYYSTVKEASDAYLAGAKRFAKQFAKRG